MLPIVQPLILAAGKGTRMNNPDLPKVLNYLVGRPMLSHLLDSFSTTSFLSPVLVVGYKGELIKDVYGPSYHYVEQTEQLGTGHAVRVTQEALQGQAEHLLVAYGDNPLWSAETLNDLAQVHGKSGAVLTMATVTSDHSGFYNFGRIVRDENGELKAIIEYKDCSAEEKEITEYNPGLYIFKDEWLWEALEKIGTANANQEYYLTDLVTIAVQNGLPVATVPVKMWQESLGINTPEQLQEAEKVVLG